MADPATIPSAAAPAPLPADLAVRILELAIAWARAYDVRNVREEHELAAYLRATVREVPAWIGSPTLDAIAKLRVDVNADGAAYEIDLDGRFVAVRLFDVTGDDALVHFEPEQAARFRADLSRVLLAFGGPP
jgi:hypothetical protein